MVARMMETTGATKQSRGAIHKTVAQLVLLYGRESWVMKGGLLKVLEGFHHRPERRIPGLTVKRGAGEEW